MNTDTIPLVSTSPVGATQLYNNVSSQIPTSSVAAPQTGIGGLIGNAFTNILGTVTQAGQNAASIISNAWTLRLADRYGFAPQTDSSPIAETEYAPVRTAPVQTEISTQNKVLIGGGVAGGILLLVLLLKK